MHRSENACLARRLKLLRFAFHFVVMFFTASLVGFAQDPGFGAGVIVGTNQSASVWEASGLVASRQNPGVLWTHNDSGFRGSVFALNTNGAALGRYYVPDVFSGDFEDIAIGPGPQPQFQYIYLGDIGDNGLVRESIRVFRFPEPAAYAYQSNAPVELPLVGAEEISLSYPDGPFNAEAMMVDPITGDLFIATKHTNTCRIYRATGAELNSGGPVTLTFVAEPVFRSASAADISADGTLIAIRRPGRGGLWVRKPGQSIADALKVAPITIPVIGQPTEPNGEAIGFDANASGYYTISEGFSQPIYYFPRMDTLPAPARVLVEAGGDWDVNDFGEPLPASWKTNFDEVSFSGPAPLGFGGGERSTVGANAVTTYFLRRFESDVAPTNLALHVSANDGFAIYLNGNEILRRYLAPGSAFDDFALASNFAEARYWFTVPVNPAFLQPGDNVIAAEVHRADPDSAAMTFDLQLLETPATFPAKLDSFGVADGVVTGTVTGAAGLAVPVERSFDLLSWSPAATVVLTNGVAVFTEPVTNSSAFYRIRSPAMQ